MATDEQMVVLSQFRLGKKADSSARSGSIGNACVREGSAVPHFQ